MIRDINLVRDQHRMCQTLLVVNLDIVLLREGMGRQALTMIAKACPRLEKINTTGLTIGPAGLREIADRVTKLIHLQLERALEPVDPELYRIVQGNASLEKLEISNNPLTGKGLEAAQLKVFECTDCDNLKAEPLANTIRRQTEMRSLQIRLCKGVIGSG
ncbi:uncharacterized protein LOC125501066 [Athalia rosae]|uniref:uncharacterized protein LOC125501066 n=1 Tax=Athalia rosae TaxID=37344 RepID=UPI0020339B76|nr:uncharacterized protein LOC125501066 [Athalia rosae]